MSHLTASFAPTSEPVVNGPLGQTCHRDHLAQSDLYVPRVEQPRDGVWCVVGNGLANITAIDAPDGLIIIDTGECVEECAAALTMVRDYTDRPIAAVIYSHFHYVSGTEAIAGERSLDDLPIWGHALIPHNLLRASAEIGPAYTRGLIHQMGIRLPADGPDALVNVGLGNSFVNPAHAPRTPGYVAPTNTFDTEVAINIAGLDVVMTPAPSDADDSITIWFPSLGLAVNNLVWPALFNVFAIRGEAYRDPTVLLTGLDHLLGLGADYLVGAHGPPLVGADEIAREARLYRDSIQYIWDQTVRGTNRGLTVGELIEFVQLPDVYGKNYLTAQRYGVAEHHVRQVRNGLLGWFDGYDAELFPLPTRERCQRLIDGFGGRDAVADQARAALAADDVRWALELATWLVRSEVAADGRADGGTPDERALLASVLRTIGQRTTSANVRNHCLTRALELEGSIDLTRYRAARFAARAILEGEPIDYVHALRVQLDPERVAGIDLAFAVELDGSARSGLHVRNGVAVPIAGTADEVTAELHTDTPTFADLWSGRVPLEATIASGQVTLTGDVESLQTTLTCFDAFAR